MREFKGHGNIFLKKIDFERGLSEDEKVAFKEARKRQIVFDKDCPETTPERALKFRRVIL